MFSSNEISQVYDTILSIPGMNEMVKISFQTSRKNVLLLNRVIERGLALKQDEQHTNLLDIMPEENLQELSSLANDCLKKAGLIELSEKLKSLHSR